MAKELEHMNKELQDRGAISIRSEIKEGLAECTEAQIMIFKRMYSHKDLEKPINEVVDSMPYENLETALDQVRRTFVKNSKLT